MGDPPGFVARKNLATHTSVPIRPHQPYRTNPTVPTLPTLHANDLSRRSLKNLIKIKILVVVYTVSAQNCFSNARFIVK